MTNIAVTFRQEITRLARREIRSQTQGLRKVSAQFRKAIAELITRIVKPSRESETPVAARR